MTTVEPEWTEEEQAVMLALQQWREGLCPSCGLPRDECMDPRNEDRYEAIVSRCHATTAMIRAAERYRESPQPDALLYGARLRG